MKLNVIMPTSKNELNNLHNRISKAGAFLVYEYVKKLELTSKEKKEILYGISQIAKSKTNRSFKD